MTKTKVAGILATWFGCGLFPGAPGTVGSLGALIPIVVASHYWTVDGWWVAACGILLFSPAVWAAEVTATESGRKDPGLVVVDEVVGQWIAVAGAARVDLVNLSIAFVLFRIFDIWKPFPIRRLEKLPGGLGIVADDALAGVYAAVVLFMMGWLKHYLYGNS